MKKRKDDVLEQLEGSVRDIKRGRIILVRGGLMKRLKDFMKNEWFGRGRLGF